MMRALVADGVQSVTKLLGVVGTVINSRVFLTIILLLLDELHGCQLYYLLQA